MIIMNSINCWDCLSLLALISTIADRLDHVIGKIVLGWVSQNYRQINIR